MLENGVRAPNRLMARDCSLSTAFAYCPVANRGWPDTDSYVSENLRGSRCEAHLWISSERSWGRNIQAVKSDHFEASAKASAHFLIAKPTPAICRDLACLE